MAIPELVTVAIELLLLVHVPPVAGINEVVPPIHNTSAPVIFTVALGLTVIKDVGLDTHPVTLLVNTNVVLPAATPVTMPPFVMEAIEVLLLTQDPPDEGDKVVVPAIQIESFPEIETVGLPLITIAKVLSLRQAPDGLSKAIMA